MNDQKFDLSKLRIASPCSVGWETMTGDERTRRCDRCSLNVYNLSELTKGEAQALILGREGRLCIRMYRRADGTVLTRDCPVGLRAVSQRTVRFAAAAFAAILGLFSVSFGQKDDKKALDASKLLIKRVVNQTQRSSFSGQVLDRDGAVISNSTVKLISSVDGNKRVTTTNEDGMFRFDDVQSSTYRVEISSYGFKPKKVKGLRINSSEDLRLDFRLEGAVTVNVTVGMVDSFVEFF